MARASGGSRGRPSKVREMVLPTAVGIAAQKPAGCMPCQAAEGCGTQAPHTAIARACAGLPGWSDTASRPSPPRASSAGPAPHPPEGAPQAAPTAATSRQSAAREDQSDCTIDWPGIAACIESLLPDAGKDWYAPASLAELIKGYFLREEVPTCKRRTSSAAGSAAISRVGMSALDTKRFDFYFEHYQLKEIAQAQIQQQLSTSTCGLERRTYEARVRSGTGS
jgi:hypothetical protein